MYEFEKTIQSLWNVVIGKSSCTPPLASNECVNDVLLKDFVRQNPHYVVKDNALGFITDNGGDTYNLCHCELFKVLIYSRGSAHAIAIIVWSNFEIADLDFWRGMCFVYFVLSY